MLHTQQLLFAKNNRLDARGFILGSPIALALKKPFIMVRKPGKMPNTLSSKSYLTEYGEREGLTIQRDKVKAGDRVLIVDDLVATGGTLSSAIQLIHALGGTVVECCCVVELKQFTPSRTRLFLERNIAHVPLWALVSEEILTVEGQLPDDYVDDGDESHNHNSVRASVYR
jgi:adenine phosphoribosyltransferase